MKKKGEYLIKILNHYRMWFLLLLFFNILYSLLLWLQDTETFWQLFPVMLIGSVGLYLVAVCICSDKNSKKISNMKKVLQSEDNTWMMSEEELLWDDEKRVLYTLRQILQEKNDQMHHQVEDMEDYREFTESWAHEVKTPLALMTLVLDNRKEEMSEDVYNRLQYGCRKIQDDVEKMLYYGRLQANCTDYLFESVDLRVVCDEVIDEYFNLISEQKIDITNSVASISVMSDERGLKFCLRQVLANAIQYTGNRQDKKIHFYTVQKDEIGKVILSVKDNGAGVKAYDRPFIFQKGFTGDKGGVNQTATGMGLYLTAEMARHLKIEIETPECQEGFEISFIFNL